MLEAFYFDKHAQIGQIESWCYKYSWQDYTSLLMYQCYSSYTINDIYKG